MDILFLTDNFPPETNAPASRTFEHAKRWVRAGHSVTVLTCAPNFPSGKVFPGYRNRFVQSEDLEGIRVVRVWTYITANSGFLKRTLDYVSFGAMAFVIGLWLRRPSVIVGTSPQFFTAVSACALGAVKLRPFVFELRDLWPDSIAAVGAMRESIAIRLLRKLEYFMYRRAARIVSVTTSFKAILSSNGIVSSKIGFVPNGVDADYFIPGEKPTELIQRWGLEGKFVAAYVGTIGMAHGLGSLLSAARTLRHRNDIAFLLVGTGAEAERLASQCRAEGLENVHFVGAVSKEVVKQYWQLCDVALVLLRDSPLFQHVIPSKMFEAMGMRRSIILGVRGESAEILSRSGAGICITPESDSELAGAILRLQSDSQSREKMADAGYKFVRAEYNREILAQRMLAELELAAMESQ